MLALGTLLGLCPCAFALDPSLDVNQYAHTAWTARDGFFKGTIRAIAQMPDGYLWLGTEFGLLRFDGVRAVPWQPSPDQHLPSNDIYALLVAHDGTVWIGTTKGLASWKDGKLTQYAELAEQYIFRLLEDRGGTVWAGSQGAPTGRLCAIRDGTVHCFGEDGSFGRGVAGLYEDSKGNLWVGVQDGIWRWKPDPPNLYAIPGSLDTIKAFCEDDDGTLLFVASSGIRRLVKGNAEAYPLARTLPQQFVGRMLFRDHRDGSLWIGTDHGIIHKHQGQADVFSQLDGLSGDAIQLLFEDREGNIWVATLDGLDRFRDFAVTTISVKQDLSNVTSVLAASDGSVWFGTLDGVRRLKNGRIGIYGKLDANLKGSNFKSLLQDSRGRIWVSTARSVGYLENDRFVSVSSFPGVLVVHSIAEDTAGNLWLANQLGLIQLSGDRVIQQISWAKLGRKDFATTAIGDPLEGGLWLGFWQGGVAYFKDGQVHESYAPANGLGEGRVDDLQFDRDGTLWAATQGGLSRVKNGHVDTLTARNGLPCNAVHWMMEDDENSVWLYMACGLVRIARPELDAWVRNPKRTIQSTVFDSSDGVTSHTMVASLGPHVSKSPDGKIWFKSFLSYDGVSVIDPRKLHLNKLPPPVHIEQITADRKSYWQNSSGDLSSSPPKLPPLVRDLEIDYTALSFVAPEKNRFRVKLEGRDRDWQDVGTRRQAFYTNLAPRKYRFRVMACNNSGVWNEAGTFLDFSIAPTYWQTNWFRTLCVAVFVAILWAAHRLRVRALERRQALLEGNQALLERNQQLLERHQSEIGALNERLMKAQEEERVRIAGELHDGVLQKITSLALELATATIELPADSEPKAEVREVEKKLIEVGTEIRQLSHELHPAVLQEAGLPAALSSYCEEFGKLRGIAIAYQADKSVEELSPGAALCIYRIAQEALGNVAKHARAKQVEVRLRRSDSRVCLVVSDDGVGFNPEASGKSGGLGLINMRERVRQLNGTFEFESQPGRGTTVKAEVPFRPAP